MTEILLGRIKGSSIQAVTGVTARAIQDKYISGVVGDLYLVTDTSGEPVFKLGNIYYFDADAGLEFMCNLRGVKGNSIHAVTGNDLLQMSDHNDIVVGDLYLITADSTINEDICYGSIWKAVSESTFDVAVYTVPLKGVDYFTDQEIQAIEQRVYENVLATLASSEEVSY